MKYQKKDAGRQNHFCLLLKSVIVFQKDRLVSGFAPGSLKYRKAHFLEGGKERVPKHWTLHWIPLHYLSGAEFLYCLQLTVISFIITSAFWSICYCFAVVCLFFWAWLPFVFGHLFSFVILIFMIIRGRSDVRWCSCAKYWQCAPSGWL